MTESIKLSKKDAGTKKTWKLHQTYEELHKWSAYLQLSAERFIEELEKLSAHRPTTTREANAYNEVVAHLQTLKKESAALKTKARRLHGR